MGPLPPLLRRKSGSSNRSNSSNSSKPPKQTKKSNDPDNNNNKNMVNPNTPPLPTGKSRPFSSSSSAAAPKTPTTSGYSTSTGIPTHLGKEDDSTYVTDVSSIQFGESVTSPQNLMYDLGLQNQQQQHQQKQSPTCVATKELNNALFFQSANHSFSAVDTASPERRNMGNRGGSVHGSFIYPEDYSSGPQTQTVSQQQTQGEDSEAWRNSMQHYQHRSSSSTTAANRSTPVQTLNKDTGGGQTVASAPTQLDYSAATPASAAAARGGGNGQFAVSERDVARATASRRMGRQPPPQQQRLSSSHTAIGISPIHHYQQHPQQQHHHQHNPPHNTSPTTTPTRKKRSKKKREKTKHQNDKNAIPYELPSAITYLSLLLPVTNKGGGERQQRCIMKSDMTVSTADETMYSKDYDLMSDVYGGAASDVNTVTERNYCARERVKETVKCALGGEPIIGEEDLNNDHLRTVDTVDEDDDVYRSCGPVDADEATFVDPIRARCGLLQRSIGTGTSKSQLSSFIGDGDRSVASFSVASCASDGEANLYEITLLVLEYLKTRDYDEAIHVYKEILKHYHERGEGGGMQKSLLAGTLHNLAVVHVWKGEYDEALPYCREALRVRRELEGSAHLEVAVSLSEMGIIHYAREEFNRSLQSFRESLQISCKALGYDHPQIARILNNIACVHFETGKLIAAHATFEESLDLQRSSLGSSSEADTALLNISKTLCNVGMVSAKRRQYDAAIALIEEGLMVQESVLGDAHRVVRITSDNLDKFVYLKEGSENDLKVDHLHIVEALVRGEADSEDVNGKAVGSSSVEAGGEEGAVSSDSDDTTDMIIQDDIDRVLLGSLTHEMTTQQRVQVTALAAFARPSEKESDESGKSKGRVNLRSLFGRIPAIPFSDDRKRLPLPANVDEENIMDDELHLKHIYEQAADHLENDKVQEALELFDGVLKNHKKKYGEVHHIVGAALHNKGLVYLYAEEYSMALPLFQEAINVRTAALGPDHLDVSASLVKCAHVLLAQEDFDNTLVILSQVLRARRKTLGFDHPLVANVLNNIGCVHYECGGLLASLKAFEEALEIQRNAFKNDPKEYVEIGMASTLCNIGFVYFKRKEYAEAIVSLEEGLQIQKKVLCHLNPILNTTVENLALSMAAANFKPVDGDDKNNALTEMTEMYIDMLKCSS